MTDFDLVIAGGGPVGLVTAIAARRSGLTALVVERSATLPEKACGEGLMPGGVRALEALGVVLEGSSEFEGIRFVDGELRVDAPFPSARGRALRRSDLMLCLDRAARASGVEVRRGHTLRNFSYERSVLQARLSVDQGASELCVSGRLLVAADGLRSAVRRRLGYELPPRYPPRFGLARHYACAPWSSWVEVHWHQRAEAYVTPLGAGRVGVAILTHGRPPGHDAALRLFPALERRLAAAARGRARGAGPFEQRVKSVLAPGVALVGDAAGYLDALTGEGLSLGFRAAVALVERFAQGELWRYPRDHAEIGRAYYGLTHFMLALSRRPGLRRRVFDWMGRSDATLADLMALASDTPAPPRSALGLLSRAWLSVAR